MNQRYYNGTTQVKSFEKFILFSLGGLTIVVKNNYISTMKQGKDTYSTNLRLPNPLVKKLKASAKKNQRSMNGEIIAAIEKQIFDTLSV